ncbi:MAG TPA: hypothetical protein VHK24_03070 [Steroidobacter sp.]|jgi:hypothetical protein|nr:hypothetical protein [Steroidobacter sp.]
MSSRGAAAPRVSFGHCVLAANNGKKGIPADPETDLTLEVMGAQSAAGMSGWLQPLSSIELNPSCGQSWVQ